MAGAALAGAGVLLLVLLHLVAPPPVEFHEVKWDLEAGRAVDADRLRIAVFGGVAGPYDAERDRTLVLVAFCSHVLCGPGVWMEGDLRGRLPERPWLLVPTQEGEVRIEPAPQATPAPGQPPAFPPSEGADTALSVPFEVRSPWPSFLGRGVALALLFAGVPLLLPRFTDAEARWMPAAALAGVLVGSAMRQPALAEGLLFGFATFVGTLATLALLLAAALTRRRRVLAWALAALLLLVAARVMASVASGHFPVSGAGD